MNDRRAQAQAGAGAPAAYNPMLMFKLRTHKNNQQMITYIIAMATLAVVFLLFAMGRAVASPAPRASILTRTTRAIRRTMLRPMPALPSVGHGALVWCYLVINVAIAFTNTDPALTPLSNYGSRMAWMAIANMMVVVLLALKNTPIALISPWSYERLNILHQVAGIMMIIFVILHASLYAANFTSLGLSARLLERKEIFGMVAGLSFVLLGLAGVVIRRWWYELFYYIHVALWVLGTVMVCLHQPAAAKKVVYIVPVAGGIWLLDRIIRLARIVAYSSGNNVTLTPLPHGATRVVLEKPPLGARAAKHCFLWIPRIRPTEAHPFTIVATSPVEFVISSYDGFTAGLHRYAQAHPGAKLRASVDGPYGTNPDPKRFDKTVLVAGGSGVTFTLGVAMDMLNKMDATDNSKEIVFIWIVRRKAYLSWFAEQLNALQHDARFRVMLYVTRETLEQVSSPSTTTTTGASTPDTAGSMSRSGGGDDHDLEKAGGVYRNLTASSEKGSNESGGDDDLATPVEGLESHIHRLPVSYERPKVAELVERAIDDTPAHQSVLVMACGPNALSTQVRRTTAGKISGDGPSVELHCEQFGW